MTHRFKSLSLQQKVSIALVSVMSAMVGLMYLALSTTVAPAFDSLERSIAEINLVRAERAIQNDVGILAASTGDWAPWDDAYAFVRGENPGFEKSNLDQSTLENLGLDLVVFYDVKGKVLWAKLLLDGETADPASLTFVDTTHPEHAILTGHTSLDNDISGLVQTRLGPMLLSSRPIVTSAKEGPIGGTIIMAQFFDADRRERLQERTEVDLGWHLIDGNSSIETSLQGEIAAAGAGSIRQVVTRQSVESYTVLNDLFGEPLLILQVSSPRRISSLGESTVGGALIFLSATGIVLAAVTWWLLRSSIILPLERLARHITGIRESGDLSLMLNDKRGDEIGALASEFDLMTKELHGARRLLLQQSFNAGKADTAAEVLHNVRNAMTPLTNGIERLSKDFQFASSLRIAQATEELAGEGCSPERREKLLKYIGSAFEHIKEAGDSAVADLQIASQQARQVEVILDDQEKYANVAPVLEMLELAELLEEAALVIPAHDRSKIRVNLQQGVSGLRVKAHRIGLVQVLGSLILNASEAIKREDPGAGDIEVSTRLEEGTAPMVRVTVRDTGCGFDEDVRKRVFQSGFSSKTANVAGPGLHWCANAIAAMGGRIAAESAGWGRGAAFHLHLPSA